MIESWGDADQTVPYLNGFVEFSTVTVLGRV